MSNEEHHYAPQNLDEEIQLRRLQQDYQGAAHRDVSRANLAKLLVALMGISVIVYFIALTVAIARGSTEAIETLRNAFNAWLPVMSGFVGAAIAYYFTKDKS